MMLETVLITFVNPSGEERVVNAKVGLSLLEVAREDGNIDIEGACEGSLACSTCHVIISQEWYDKLPKASIEEEDMLDLAPMLTQTSRLGCQIIVTKELEGLKVMLPKITRNL